MSHEHVCQYCRSPLTVCRNPKQHYCNQKECQKRRKNLWRQAKRAQDADYKDNQRQAHQRWQQAHPDYWRQYRKAHPEYANRNRELQRARDQRRTVRQGAHPHPSHLAKSDATTEKIDLKPGTYRLIPLDGYLAKSDAYTVKIDLITESYLAASYQGNLAKRPLYSQSQQDTS